MEQRLARLEDQVEALQAEVGALRRELARVTDSNVSGPNISAVTSVSVGGYNSTGSVVSALDYPVGGSAAPNAATAGTQSWSVREAICDEIALWLTRSLNGDHRGSSGRDRLNLPSRVWVVARDFEGNDFNAPRVYRQFGSCKSSVKRGTDCGQSIFVGLPSQREAFRVISAAGLSRPAELLD